jgi:hypothetical protein
MDDKAFYPKLTQALLHCGFQLRASDLATSDLAEARDPVSAFAKALTQVAPSSIGEIHPFFNQEIVQQRLNEVHEWAAIVAVKYVLAQPVILAVVEADRLSSDDFVNLAKRLDDVVVQMLDSTARLGGSQIAGIKLTKGTRMGSTGIILNVFFEHGAASTFIERAQKRCKIFHLLKKTWVLPWAVDVSAKTVNSHRGLPFLPGVMSRDDLQKEIFS